MKKDVFRSSNLGVIYLDKELSLRPSDRAVVNQDSTISFQEDFLNGYNRTLGLDLNFALLRGLDFGGFLAQTYTPGIKGRDWAADLYLSWANDLFSFTGSHMEIGENFNPEMGFLLQSNVRRTKLGLGYSPRPGIRQIRQAHFFLHNEFITDWQNSLLTRSSSWGVYNRLESGGHLMLGLDQTYERLTKEYEFEIREGKWIKAGEYSSPGLVQTAEGCFPFIWVVMEVDSTVEGNGSLIGG